MGDKFTYLQNLALPDPALNKLGVEFAALFAVPKAKIEGSQLGVAGGAVGIQLGVIRIAFYGLGIVLHCCAIVT